MQLRIEKGTEGTRVRPAGQWPSAAPWATPVQLRPIHLGLRRRRRPSRRAAAAARPSRRCCPCSRRRAGVHQARQANCSMHSSWLLHDGSVVHHASRHIGSGPSYSAAERSRTAKQQATSSIMAASHAQRTHGSMPHACEQSRAGRMRRATARMPPPQRSRSVVAASWRMCQCCQKKDGSQREL